MLKILRCLTIYVLYVNTEKIRYLVVLLEGHVGQCNIKLVF